MRVAKCKHHLRVMRMRKPLVGVMSKTGFKLSYYGDIAVQFHTFFFCSTSSDTLATISSSESPVREPCLLWRTSLINPVSSNLLQKRNTSYSNVLRHEISRLQHKNFITKTQGKTRRR